MLNDGSDPQPASAGAGARTGGPPAVEHDQALRDLVQEAGQLHEDASALRAGVVEALLACVEAHHAPTVAHVRAVQRVARAIARELRLARAESEQVAAAAVLHDIGKLAVDPALLDKPGALTAQEQRSVAVHSARGAEILSRIPGLEAVSATVRHEHERWDGTGEPLGLAGTEIPLAARIVAVADAHETLTAGRPWRAALEPAASVRELQAVGGTQFDPEVVGALAAWVERTGGAQTSAEAEPASAAGEGGATVRDLQALVAVAVAAGRATRLEDVFAIAAAEAHDAVGAASSSISRWDPELNELRTLHNFGELAPWEERWPSDERYALAEDPDVELLLTEGRPYMRRLDDPAVSEEAASHLRKIGKSADVAVPIVFDGRIWGELSAAIAPGEPPPGPRQLRLMEAVSSLLAMAIDRSELIGRVSDLAFRDPLTGLANRRALDDRLESALERVPEGVETTLVLCDIDDFKGINDTFGHEAGDIVLARMADAMRQASEQLPGVLLARSGGDEFCAVLEGSDLSVAERFCRVAAALIGDGEPAVTAAWGAATTADGSRRRAELFRAADAAQYTAKRAGRGRICLSRPEQHSRATPDAGPGRRRLRDDRARDTNGLIPDAVAALDRLPGESSLVDRLAAVAVPLARTFDASSWAVSLHDPVADSVHAVRGEATVLDPESGSRMVRLVVEDSYSVSAYPRTAQALAEGSCFHVRVDDPDADAAEREAIAELGYDAVVAIGVHDSGGGAACLLEVYGDERTPDFADAASYVRVLAALAAAG